MHDHGACSHGHHHDHKPHAENAESRHSRDEHGHEHSHHDHGHSHSHHRLSLEPTQDELRQLKIVFALTLLYLLIELGGAWVSGSLALLADGFHMLADAAGIGISLGAQWALHRPAPRGHTFGYQRLEVLAAFMNALGLLAMSVFILWESVQRLQHPMAIHATVMFPIAVGGFLINLISLKLLHAGHNHNLNVKGAYLHVFSDLLGSVGAMLAGALIFLFGWTWADPALSMLIGILICINAIGLLKEAGNILLEGCPAQIDILELRSAMLAFPEIHEVHHLHVWNINSQNIVLTAHLVVDTHAFGGELLNRVQRELKQSFGLSHVTLQLEVVKAQIAS
jgi:cobalt-zinc-cadmium efflux system protein